MKFPANLLTVPDMGRLQLSQMIRMFSSRNVEIRAPNEARPRYPSHLLCHKALGRQECELLNDPNEMDSEHERQDSVRKLNRSG